MNFSAELIRREVRCIDPLRLLAAYPTRKDWAAARPADIETLVDPKELPRLNSLSPEARREVFVRDVGLIYDVAESAEARAGRFPGSSSIGWQERSPRIRFWPGPRSTCWSIPTRRVTRPAPPPRPFWTTSSLAFGSTAASWTWPASASLRPVNSDAPRGGRPPGLDLRRRDLCGLSEPRVCRV